MAAASATVLTRAATMNLLRMHITHKVAQSHKAMVIKSGIAFVVRLNGRIVALCV